ncbi:hypothetical protein ACFL18_02055 [Patescibacteria group bacterium]
MKLLGAFNNTGTDSTPDLTDQLIEQTFISPFNYLNQIDLIFSQAPKQKSTSILLTLSDQNSQVTAISSLNPSQTNSFISFNFSPIKNSYQKTYTLKVQIEGSVQEPIYLKTSPHNYYPDGQLLINQFPQSGDLVFRTYHYSDSNPVNLIANSLINRFKADPAFTLFYGFSLAIFTLIIIKSLISGSGKRKKS